MVGIRLLISIMFFLLFVPAQSQAVFMYDEKELNTDEMVPERINENIKIRTHQERKEVRKQLMQEAHEQREKREETLTPFIGRPEFAIPEGVFEKAAGPSVKTPTKVSSQTTPVEEMDYQKMIWLNLIIPILALGAAFIAMVRLFKWS